MKTLSFAFIFAFLISCIPMQCIAYGHQGHALIAEIAFNYMDASTKRNVMKYLDGMTIEDAANWMDAIKKDHANDYMKPFHYIDIEKGGKEVPAGDNIITVLNRTLASLDNRKSLSKDEIKMNILFLFHLIGDLHQPLHVGYPGDKGGNTVQVSLFGHGTNLHSLWDSGIIEYKGMNLPEILKSSRYTALELAGVKKIDVIAWATQSRGYLRDVYNLQGAKVNDMYIDHSATIIESQLLNAGIRLGAVLDYYFKDGE